MRQAGARRAPAFFVSGHGRGPRLVAWGTPLLLAACMLLVSVRLGTDASWDLRNYHLYDSFALLHKPGWTDLAPAQRQSFHPPMLDLPAFWLRLRLNHWPRLVCALLALPSAAAVLLAWGIGRTLQQGGGLGGRAGLTLALLFGASGAAGLPTTGTSMSEMPAACFMLGGVLLLLQEPDAPAMRTRVWMAGLLFGIAVGLKPTQALFAAAAVLAQLLCGQGGGMARLAGAARLGIGVAAGAVCSGGAWWLHMARLTGSPVFPYMNGLFRSPLFLPIGLVDDRFLPHGPGASLLQPFLWAWHPSRAAGELDLRDPRLALAWIAAVSCLLRLMLPILAASAARRQRFLLVFCVAAAVLWQRQFSILRYLAPIELLSGLLVLMALAPLRRLHRWLPEAALGVLLAAAIGWTIYPDWGRTHSGVVASVALPALGPGAMVLLLDGSPMAYVAAFADPRVRFVGIDNNLLLYGRGSRFDTMVSQAVRQQAGPLWGLEVPAVPDAAGATLTRYGLHRRLPCLPVRSSLEADGLRLCPLAR